MKVGILDNRSVYKILKENIQLTISSLEALVEECCWNKISNNYLYILTDISELEYSNFHELRTTIRKINNKKRPKDLDSVLKSLTEIYSDLYDINCYIFRAEKDFTIVEIQYYKKSNLDRDFAKKVRDNPPMYHARV